MSFLKKKLFVSVDKIWTAHKAFHFFSIFRQLGTLIISIVFSNADIGLEFIGNYEFLLFIGTTFTLFVSQGFLDAFNLLFDSTNRKITFSVYSISLLVGIVIGAFLIGFESQIVHYLTSTSEVAFYQLYAIFIIIDFNTWLTPILLLRGDNKKTLTLYTIVVNTLWVIIVTLPVILNFNPQWIFIGLIGISVFKQFFLIVLIIQHADCTIDWNIGREWLRKSVPFIGYALLGGFHLIADNWMVGHYFPRDKEIFAIFRYGARELPFSIIIAAAFSTAIVPVLQKKNTYGLKTFKKKWKKLSSILILLAFFALVFSKKIFLIVYGAEFELSAEIFSIYILVILSRILILKPLIMTQNLNHWLVPIAISELIVNVSLSYLLVPIFGLSGIAWGTVIAYSYEKIFMILLLKIKNKLSPVQYLSIPHFTMYVVIIIICFVLV